MLGGPPPLADTHTNRGRDEVRLDARAGLHQDPLDHRVQQLLELLGSALGHRPFDPAPDPGQEVVGRQCGGGVMASTACSSEPDVHEDYVSAYDLGRFAESARFVRQYSEQNPVLGELLARIATPTQILAGRDDDLVPWSNNQYLDDRLPNSELHPLDAGHFAWEQAAEDYGRLVVDWVSGGYRRVAAG
jgi:pimeloyl-ACP methyl ester carboxylesterase